MHGTYTLHQAPISRQEADVIGTAQQEYSLPLQLVDWNLGKLSYITVHMLTIKLITL